MAKLVFSGVCNVNIYNRLINAVARGIVPFFDRKKIKSRHLNNNSALVETLTAGLLFSNSFDMMMMMIMDQLILMFYD